MKITQKDKNFENIVRRNQRKLKRFFKIKVVITVRVIDNLRVIYKIFRIKPSQVPWYAVGFCKGNNVYILDSALFRERKCDPNEFPKVMLHEMCHIYLRAFLNKRKIPVWLEEGFCNYFSFGYNLKPKKIPPNVLAIKTYHDWYKYDSPFLYCSLIFLSLAKNYGKNKLFLFLEKLKLLDLEQAFLEVFSIPIQEYIKEFNRTLK